MRIRMTNSYTTPKKQYSHNSVKVLTNGQIYEFRTPEAEAIIAAGKAVVV